jgi:hypothetical protein
MEEMSPVQPPVKIAGVWTTMRCACMAQQIIEGVKRGRF